jgi:glycosyltransferase involved in cell wall biosynthesis
MGNATENKLTYLQGSLTGVSVVIPCKDEEDAVGQTVVEVRQALETTGLDYEVIVVDDGSSDSSSQEALDAGAMVLSHRTNLGYGNAIMNGMSVAKFPLIAILDADGTYPPAMLPRMIDLASRHDMVIGQRIWETHNTTRFSLLLRRLLGLVIAYFTSATAPDFNSGFRVFHKSDLLNFRPLLCPTFSFTTSLTLLFLLTHRSVRFIPIEYATRIGSSKVAILRDALRTFSYVFLMANLFQAYRLAIIFLALGTVSNLLVLLLAGLGVLGLSGQVGLHVIFSLFTLVCMAGVSMMPMTRVFLRLAAGSKEGSPY